MLGVFSGFYDTKNGKNKDIFYSWVIGLPLWLPFWGGGGVHWVQLVQGAGASGGVFLPFVRFIALSLVRCLRIWLYFAF